MSTQKLMILTDDVISQYSKNNVLKEYRDIDLKVTTMIQPYQNGVYDPDIFGSCFSDRCNCGTIKIPNLRCPRCGSMILDDNQIYKRFARVEVPVYYCTKYKFYNLIKFLKSNFNISIETSIPELEGLRWQDQKALDILQWNYDSESGNLKLTDNITDFTKCSWEGLLSIIKEHYPDKMEEFRAYINRFILITPLALRPPQIRMVGNSRVLENSYTTSVYKNIIYLVEDYYKNTFPTLKDELTKAVFRGSLRKLISDSMDQLSNLMKASKANLAREMQSNRLANSGRCTVVPDPSLKADEVTIPIHLIYEACRSEFIPYLAKRMNISEKEAENVYKTQSDLDQVQDIFKEYIEGEPGKPETGKYIIINRAPSLYEYAMFSCKVKLSYDYAMKIPMALCTPTNGDFDGDTYSFYSVPKEMNKMVNDALSAKNRFLYKKNWKPLFTPTKEILKGLTIATKVSTPSKLEKFDSIEDAKDFRKTHRDFKWQTLCIIDDTKTTLGRAILTELFDKDLNAYLGNFNTFLNAKNLTLLYQQLEDKSDRLDRIQKIQEFALTVVTQSGDTAISMSDIYYGMDNSYLKRIQAIEKDDKIDDRSKEFMIRDIHKEFQEHELSLMTDKMEIIKDNPSDKKSINALVDMAVQQLNVGPDHKYSVATTTLTRGLSPTDYSRLAIENRSILDIKQLSVPQSGYLTRQFTYLASEYQFSDGEDPNNKGIKLTRSQATGRTDVKGNIVSGEGDDEVLVRSIVTSTRPTGIITRDMLTNQFKYKPGSNVGMNLMSSLTEQLTQSGLSLKHGGHLFNFNPVEKIIAPDNGVLEVQDNKIVFKAKNKSYIYPKSPDRFVLNYKNESNTYNKGDVIGRHYHPVTATYNLDCIIKLCSASSTSSTKRFGNNIKIESECYAINDGTIHYKFDPDGNCQVFVDGQEYDYNPECVYLYPDGHKVKKYDRICSGILNMKSMIYKVTDPIELFYFFRLQFSELISGLSPELVEFVYKLLVTTDDSGNIELQSVSKSIHGSDSFFKSLAFNDARKSFQKIDYQGMDFVADPITSVILSMIVNNEIK